MTVKRSSIITDLEGRVGYAWGKSIGHACEKARLTETPDFMHEIFVARGRASKQARKRGGDYRKETQRLASPLSLRQR